MESGISAGIIMDCLTDETNRVTVVECEKAFIYGDESFIEVRYEDDGRIERFDFRWTESLGYHAKADFHIVKEFIESIREGHLQTKTSVSDALMSHLICFRADE